MVSQAGHSCQRNPEGQALMNWSELEKESESDQCSEPALQSTDLGGSRDVIICGTPLGMSTRHWGEWRVGLLMLLGPSK